MRGAGEALRAAWHAFFRIAIVVAPTYAAVVLFKHSPLLPWTVARLEPLMSGFGLPGEAALPLVLGMTLNIYAAVAACAGLDLSPGQATTLALVLGFAHNLFVEGAVLMRLTPRAGWWIALRVATAVVAGLALGPMLAARWPGTLAIAGSGAADAGLVHDLVAGGLRSIGLIAAISIPIVFLLELARAHGLLARLRRPLEPAVRALGLDARGTEALLAGMGFGLVYGAGVIVSRIEEEGLPRAQVDRICIVLVLCHAIVEDTLLFLPVHAVLAPVVAARVAAVGVALLAFAAFRRAAPAARGA